MKLFLITLMVIPLQFQVNAQEFINGDFETVTCTENCDAVNKTIDCLANWSTTSTPNLINPPLQRFDCPGDIVCSDVDNEYSVELAASTGSGVWITTLNPYYGMDLGGNPAVITMKQHVVSTDTDGLGVIILGRTEIGGIETRLGFNAPSEDYSCEDVAIAVDPSIVDFEYLTFATTNRSYNAHGGGSRLTVIDDIDTQGSLFEYIKGCDGDLTVSLNNLFSGNFNSSLVFYDIVITNEDGGIEAVFSIDDPVSFADFTTTLPENGTYNVQITLALERNGFLATDVLDDFGDPILSLLFLEYNETIEITSIGEECCDGFTNSNFILENFGSGLAATGYETYAEFDATHEWTVYNSASATGGPYYDVTEVTTTTESDVVLVDEISSGLYYTVLHRVISECGELCSVEIFRGLDEGEEAPEPAEITCEVMECMTTAPTEISFSSGTNTLTWDATSLIDQYVVRVFWDSQNCCGNRRGRSATYIVTGNSFVVPGTPAESCTGFIIGAYCNETDISWSELACFYKTIIGTGFRSSDGDQGNANNQVGLDAITLQARISPVPSEGNVNVILTNNADTPVRANLYSMSGELIYSKSDYIEDGRLAMNFNFKDEITPGVYLFVFTTDNETVTQKVIFK